MTNQKRGYNTLIKLGRMLDKGSEYSPEFIIEMVNRIEKDLRFTPIETFVQLFPPIKRYEEDGMWNYYSALNVYKTKLGTHFGKKDLHLLMFKSVYENKYIAEVSVSFLEAVSSMRRKQTGLTLFEEFTNKHLNNKN